MVKRRACLNCAGPPDAVAMAEQLVRAKVAAELAALPPEE